MSKKRRREQQAVDTHLVEIYEDLANVDENIRLKAAHTLLTKFVSEGNATGEQLNEIVRRLLRGLCSGRKAARLGFSITLTEVLTELLGPTGKNVEGFQDIPGLIETLKTQTHVAGNVAGQVSCCIPLLYLLFSCMTTVGGARPSIRTSFWRRVDYQIRDFVSIQHYR